MVQFIFSTIMFFLVLLLAIYFLQRHLIYFPEQDVPSPLESGVPEMQTINLHTDDGLKLTAWYSPPAQPERATILYLHGNAGHIGYRSMLIRSYLNDGYGVLLLTYRGFSGNPGTPSEVGLYKDARAGIQFLHMQGISDECLVCFGESLGGAVAIQMATEYDVGALILQSPFTSLSDIGQYHYPFFPVKWLIKDKYASIEKINLIQCPVLVILAKNDNIVPPAMSRRLFEAILAPKKLLVIPGKGHNSLDEPVEVIRFLQNYVPC
ncbi:MAG: alpha/beta hydrolase [Parachlamydiaceae bacterium]|nr:alpha/beta hydrolase [Parachlamydiaceae bacterium]